MYSIQTAPGRCCELILGPVRDFGKALRIALCQRGVQNQLKGLHTFVVLLAGMPGSITGSWLVMVLSCWSTVGENVSQGGSGITNSGLRSSNSPIDSHLPASAGCKTPRDHCTVFRACSGGLDIRDFHFTTLWWLKLKHGYVFSSACVGCQKKRRHRALPLLLLTKG